ncbi:MAG: hypothetical protein MJ074_06610 [Oscillospiraceae bacterium]|nr:hypothetical protein [Oscillospiraceae bacterium]
MKLESLRRHWKKHPGSNLAEQVAMRETFPTPTSFDGGHHLQPGTFKRNSLMLCEYVELQAAEKFPTPTAQDSKLRSNPSQMKRHSPPLSAVVMFPTPTVEDASRKGSAEAWEKYTNGGFTPGARLRNCVQAFPTPTCQDAKNNGSKSQQARNSKPLNAVAGGALNPDWVEWLMGWPIGWTDLKQLGTDKYRLWLRQHSEFCTGS